MKKIFYFIIIAIFCVAITTSYTSNKSVQINLPSAFDDQTLNSSDLLGQTYIMHVFASWCAACQQEHEIWLSVKDDVNLYGISYFDTPSNTQNFLTSHGNPYVMTGIDQRGITQKELNIIGVPQTFVIDKSGEIHLRIAGPVNRRQFNDQILPLYNKLLSK